MNLLPLLFLCCLAPAVMTGSKLTVSLTALSQGTSPATVGLIMGVYGLLPIFLGLPVGRLIDRIGIRIPLAGCGLLFLAGQLVPFVWPSLFSLVVCAAATGIGFMASTISVNRGVPAMSHPERRTANFGWLTLSTSTGATLGPIVAGFGIEHLGHRSTFLLLAVIPSLSLVLLLLFPLAFRVPRVEEVRQGKGRLLELLREPRLQRALILTACVPALLDVFFFVVPVIHAQTGVSASITGTVLAACGMAIFTVRSTLAWMLRYFRPWTLVTLSYLAMALSYALLPFAHSTIAMMVPAVLMGIGSGVGTPLLLSLFYAVSPAGRQGELMGLRAGMFNGLGGVLPMVIGAGSTLVGMAPVLIGLGAALLLGTRTAWQEGKLAHASS